MGQKIGQSTGQSADFPPLTLTVTLTLILTVTVTRIKTVMAIAVQNDYRHSCLSVFLYCGYELLNSSYEILLAV